LKTMDLLFQTIES